MASMPARVIAVTGASSGLGEALARGYAARGTTLGLIGRDGARLDECAQRCRAAGACAVVGVLDVRDVEAMQAWLRGFDAAHPIDLLIANAGVASTLATSNDWEDLARTRTIIEINFFGALHAVQSVADRMRLRGTGQIALVGSLAAIRGMAISPAYCASKAAIKAYAESVRPILRRDGVGLTLILPGFIKTAMSDVFPGNKPFMWSTDRAATYIRRKLDAGRAEIAFPGPLAFGMRLLTLLPPSLADAILGRLSYLPREER
ncbi:MAG: SDR family NAD(P)-dependent oxidoreductase [Paraburkholderia sp.]|uniref:SDR family NAD(P)-dependent oxidoreductase n=1 Tax=Paraburkholderia sp. TaxID=1926495 RepID=UPI0012086166|nr:SDR family NAD(P)-dependent oxidoreductase [Paraburkholderia sp.]TAM31951.1 MAG: SDR family NAD(P)-dependent oxidoreductase [Paraburkholderia sp.]